MRGFCLPRQPPRCRRAMPVTVTMMILLDAMRPPAVSTAPGFAFRAGDESNLLLFGLSVGTTAVLVVLKRLALRTLARADRG